MCRNWSQNGRENERREEADGGTRTHDPRITNALLYQLSYVGPKQDKCRGPESNWGHVDFQSTALPSELPRHAHCPDPRPAQRGPQDPGDV